MYKINEIEDMDSLPEKIIYRIYYKNEEFGIVNDGIDKQYIALKVLDKFEGAVEKQIKNVRNMLQEKKIFEHRKDGSALIVFRSKYHASLLHIEAWADGFRLFYDLYPISKVIVFVPVYRFVKYVSGVPNGSKDFAKAQEIALQMSEVVDYLQDQPMTVDEAVEKILKWKKGFVKSGLIDVIRHNVYTVVRRYGENVFNVAEGLVRAAIIIGERDPVKANMLYKIVASMIRDYLRRGGFL